MRQRRCKEVCFLLEIPSALFGAGTFISAKNKGYYSNYNKYCTGLCSRLQYNKFKRPDY